MLIKEVLDKTVQFFRDKKFDSPRLDAELIISHALKLERIQLYLKFDQPLSDAEVEACRAVVKRRTLGEPVAYILGKRDFFGFEFLVNPNVLIPRPETEHVVEYVVDWLKENQIQEPNILDLGSGSGCLGLSILKSIPNAKLTSVDISSGATETTLANAKKLEVDNRFKSINEDIFLIENNNMGLFDVIVSNPPYIAKDDQLVEENVKKFEPSIALFSDNEGLNHLHVWSKKFSSNLKSKSIMAMEIGYNQGEDLLKYYKELNCFDNVKVNKDLSGHDRVIIGEKNG